MQQVCSHVIDWLDIWKAVERMHTKMAGECVCLHINTFCKMYNILQK